MKTIQLELTKEEAPVLWFALGLAAGGADKAGVPHAGVQIMDLFHKLSQQYHQQTKERTE